MNFQWAYYHSNLAHGDDAWLSRELSPNVILDVVLDGISTANGHLASELARNELQQRLIQNKDELATALEEINQQILQRYGNKAQTTITAALTIGEELHLLNIGDSPAYLLCEGNLQEMATLDKVPWHPAIVTKVLGELPFGYHHRQLLIHPGDKIILMTDGISDNLYQQEIANLLLQRTPPEAIDALKKILEEKQKNNLGRDDVFEIFKDDDRTAIIRYF